MKNENENVNVKKTSKGMIIGIASAVAVIIIAIVLVVLKPWSAGYVAKVDNLNVTKQEYMVFSKIGMKQFLTSISSTVTPDKYDWNTKKNGEAVKEQVKKATLDQIQQNKILLIKAKEAGIVLTPDELKNVSIDQLIKTVTQSGTKADAEKAIQDAFGVSLSDYQAIYKDSLIVQKYQSAELSKVAVADDVVKKQYDDNKADYDKVTVEHILISTLDSNQVPVSAGKKQEAKLKAEDLLKQVKEGADIKALAEKYSDDKDQSGKVNSNGEYTFSKGEMVPAFEEWAFKSHVAGDADVVESDYGYHVIKFEKREETKYDDVKDKIKTSLTNSKFSDEFTKKLDGWKKLAQFAIVKNDSVLAKVDKSIYGV